MHVSAVPPRSSLHFTLVTASTPAMAVWDNLKQTVLMQARCDVQLSGFLQAWLQYQEYIM